MIKERAIKVEKTTKSERASTPEKPTRTERAGGEDMQTIKDFFSLLFIMAALLFAVDQVARAIEVVTQ